MKLRDLEAKFMTYGDGRRTRVNELSEADGIMFLCPLCFTANNGPVGTHSIVCWFTGKVPDEARPGPGRWNPTGTSIDDLSFVPGADTSSVQLLGGCNWHGNVVNGDAT